jgi:hemoglobin
MAIPTLYQWAGGKEAFEKLTKLFYEKVLRDPLLEPVFRDMAPDHFLRVAHFVGEVLGGDPLYTTEHQGSHAGMVAHHINKFLDETKRKRWVQLLFEAADEINLPDDPEFRSAFIGYIEWGSRIAVLNSQGNENPIKSDEPMPKWGWGEPGGPYIPSDN